MGVSVLLWFVPRATTVTNYTDLLTTVTTNDRLSNSQVQSVNACSVLGGYVLSMVEVSRVVISD